MKNPILKEVSRVTGWGGFIDHQAFPLLLAAVTASNVLWFFPGIARIHAAYYPVVAQQAVVVRAMPQVLSQVEIVDGMGGAESEGNMVKEETIEQI